MRAAKPIAMLTDGFDQRVSLLRYASGREIHFGHVLATHTCEECREVAVLFAISLTHYGFFVFSCN